MHAEPPKPEPLRPALDRLAAARATGALRVGGSPGGTIWLVDGQIGYADTPVVPGVGERLTGTGRITDRTWYVAYQDARHDGQVARLLVDEGHLAYGELASRVVATVYDAAYVLLADDAAPARFHAGLRHWLGDIITIEQADLDAEMERRRRRGDAGDGVPVAGSVAGPAAEPVAATAAEPVAGPAAEPVAGPVAGPVGPGAPGDGVDAAIDEAEQITAPGLGRVTAVYLMAGLADETTAELPIIRPAGAVSVPVIPGQATGGAGRAGNLPRRHPAGTASDRPIPSRTNAGQNGGPDYATLRRIRMALKVMQ